MIRTSDLADGALPRVEFWGDIQCSWCYVQREILRLVLAESGTDEVRFRTYSQAVHLHPTDRAPVDWAQEYRTAVERVADEIGLDYDCANQRPTDSHRAHELIHFAFARARQRQMVDRLYRARFAEGLDVGAIETLGALADECGLDRDEATSALRHGAYVAAVEQDNHLAYLLGVPGVPFVVINGTHTLSGAQSPSAVREALSSAGVSGVGPNGPTPSPSKTPSPSQAPSSKLRERSRT